MVCAFRISRCVCRIRTYRDTLSLTEHSPTLACRVTHPDAPPSYVVSTSRATTPQDDHNGCQRLVAHSSSLLHNTSTASDTSIIPEKEYPSSWEETSFVERQHICATRFYMHAYAYSRAQSAARRLHRPPRTSDPPSCWTRHVIYPGASSSHVIRPASSGTRRRSTSTSRQDTTRRRHVRQASQPCVLCGSLNGAPSSSESGGEGVAGSSRCFCAVCAPHLLQTPSGHLHDHSLAAGLVCIFGSCVRTRRRRYGSWAHAEDDHYVAHQGRLTGDTGGPGAQNVHSRASILDEGRGGSGAYLQGRTTTGR